MKVTPIKTAIVKVHDDLFAFIKGSVKKIPEKGFLVISSKIVSYCQGRLQEKKDGSREEKHALVRKEADLYLDPSESKYDVMLTIKNHLLAVSSGIDESNSVDDQYILWPRKPQQTVNEIWHFLRKEYQVKEVGVIMTDSKTMPLRWGVIGTAIAHCGFQALRDFIGKEDLFGRKMKMTQINVAEAVAVAAVLEMGETNEQQPLCLVEGVSLAKFQDRAPTDKELADLVIELEDDIYGPVLNSVNWKKGWLACWRKKLDRACS
ncbi:MAG: coenzyme F420-0:L-glutamate ligase [Candidatus Woesebacteria bacterium]|jgi:F420-0:gamma-glutamyl ligase